MTRSMYPAAPPVQLKYFPSLCLPPGPRYPLCIIINDICTLCLEIINCEMIIGTYVGHPGTGRPNVKTQCTITRINIIHHCGQSFNMSCVSRIIQVLDTFYKLRNSYVITILLEMLTTFYSRLECVCFK